MQTLLLDFDGVVLRNNKISEYQYRKSARFLQKFTSLTYERCLELNKKYYPQYGHTVILINQVFKNKTSLEEYNDFVFNKKTINKLEKLLDDDTYKHAKQFQMFFEKDDTYIFTNAHINWIEFFTDRFEIPVAKDKIFYPKKLDMLKPFPKIYDHLDEKFDDILFVDDSPKNLEYPSKLKKWKVCLFKESNDIDLLKQNHQIFV